MRTRGTARRGRRARGTRSATTRLLVERLEDRTLLNAPGPMQFGAPADSDPDHGPAFVPYLPAQYYFFNQSGFLTGPSAGQPLDLALAYLRSHAADLGLTPADVNGVNVITNYVSDFTGTTHLSFQQTVNGLEVANATINVNITRNGEVINVGGGFVPGADRLAPPRPPGLAAQTAVGFAAQHFGLTLPGTTQVMAAPAAGDFFQTTALVQPGASLDPITAKLHYVPVPGGGLELAWNFTLRTPDGGHWYNASIDASDGRLVNNVDYVHHASYNVFAQPLEAPHDPLPPAGRSVQTDVYDPLASPYGWHDTNGMPGAEFTDTRGNNVNAQIEGTTVRPDGGPTLTFNFPLDLTQPPSAYEDASVVNLFYWDNLLHDVHYKYGFTEAARNFQVNNYGHGGLGNDPVIANRTRDVLNNAFMSTPPDGSSPTQRMGLWDRSGSVRDSALDAMVIVHEYGHGVSNRLTGNANGLNALQSGGMGEGWSDWWGLMFTQRGPVPRDAAHGAATYLLGQPLDTGRGLRAYPYSFTITDPFLETFRAYGTGAGQSTEVHAAGTRWCSVLWDLNTLLVEKYGFDADLATGYTGSGAGAAGNKLALRLVMDGLKLQPNNPSFLQARDAILQADRVLTGGANLFEIWTAFARRGLGLSASTAGSGSSSLTVAFDLPPFGIRGTKFNDVNGSGARDPGEPALPGWTVFLDLNDNGALDDGEPSRVTDATGSYLFSNLDPGTYIVREVPRDGWTPTAPGEGSYTVTVTTASEDFPDRDFGGRPANPGSVSGAKFHDLNGNGTRDEGEPGLPGWRIFLDANDNGVLDAAFEQFTDTDAAGNYTLAGLAPGSYVVREVPQAGWVRSAPAADFHAIALDEGQDVGGADFGNYRPVTLSGQVFHDVNGNGARDPGEPGLAGWTVFVDVDGNGQLDPGEPSVVTNAQGNYTVANVRPGAVLLAQVVQANWVQTLPEDGARIITVASGGNQTGLDFGNKSGTLTGLVFRDVNGNGTRDTGDAGLANWRVYLDLNGNGVFDANEPNALTDAQGVYTLAGLAPGTYVVREVVQAGWVQTAPSAGFHTAVVEDASSPVTGLEFGNFQLVSVSGTKYNDVNGNGTRDAGEPGLQGWLIYEDLNNNGVFNPGEPFAITNAQGAYTFSGLGPGTHYFREQPLPGWLPTAPAGAVHTITTASGQNVTGRDFGSRLVNPATVSGRVFHDLDGDGARGTDEPGLQGWRIFVDANDNGFLDTGEQFADSDAQGNYTLGGLAPGTYVLREVLQSGFARSAPSAGFFTATVAAGAAVTGLEFGNYRPVSLSGVVFRDLDGDGTRQATEPGLQGWTVYADLNNNGVLDAGEPSAVSNAQGNYTLANIRPGTVVLREVLQPNWVQTAPADGSYTLTVASGATQANLNFGNQSGGVTGLVFNDLNGDGVRQPGEPGLSAGFAVFVDLNNNGLREPNEPQATPNAQGVYTLPGLPAGTYVLRQLVPPLQPPWAVTAPEFGFYTVTIDDPDTMLTGLDFGNFRLITVTGIVFNDLNADGTRQASEPLLGGWTVFDDVNGNGVRDPGEPSAVTNAQGAYTLTNIGPGDHTIRVEVQANWALTAPAGGSSTFTAVSGQNQVNRNFGAQSGTVTGQVFNDLNGNGIKDPGEPGLTGGTPAWIVYADLNGNGVLDSTEPRASPDAQGNYVLSGLPAGTVTIREVVRAGWVLTAPASGSYAVAIEDATTRVAGRDVGNFQRVSVSGTKYNDVNGNGTRDPGEQGLAGWMIFDDLDNDGVLSPGEPFAVTNAQGAYTLANIGPGTHYLREVLLPGWIATAPPGGSYAVTTASGQNVTGRDFGSRLVNPASISGTKFHDQNGDGVRGPGEPGLQNWRIFIDANNNGVLDASEQFADTDANGNYTLTGLLPGTYTVREVAQTGWIRSTPAAGFYTVTLTAGQSATGRDFGSYQLGSVSGVKFHDLNDDGVRDDDEPGLAGWTVFLDLNNNGVLDSTIAGVEPDSYPAGTDLTNIIPQVTLQVVNGPGPVRSITGSFPSTGVRVFGANLSEGWEQSGPRLRINFTVPTSSVSIDVISDDELDVGRLEIYDANNVLLGTVISRNLTFPGDRATMTLTRTTADIAYAIASGSGGEVVLLDNLQFGSGEPSAVTDATGSYTIRNLAPGTYVLREVPQPGWVQTAPPDGAYTVTLTSGQTVTGLDFGNVEEEEGGGPVAPAGAPSPFAGLAALLAGPPMAGNQSPAAGTNVVRAEEGPPPRADTAALDLAFAALAKGDEGNPTSTGRANPWPDDWFANVLGKNL